jgi:hypothetical protein
MLLIKILVAIEELLAGIHYIIYDPLEIVAIFLASRTGLPGIGRIGLLTFFGFLFPTPTVTVLLGTLTLLIEESKHTHLVYIGRGYPVDFVHFGYFAAVFTALSHYCKQ